MDDKIEKLLEALKDNIPIEEHRSEGTSDGLTHYEEDKYSWQFKLYNYITNLQEEKERLLGCLEDLYSLYHYKFDKILEQIKVIGDADLSEYNFCKFMDKIKNIIKGSDKSE